MFNLEDRLQPSPEPRSAARDLLAVGLVLLLAGFLLRDWGRQAAADLAEIGRLHTARQQAASAPDGERAAGQLDEELGNAVLSLRQSFKDLVASMCSPLLPAALGFALALRRGAVDLSVWVTAGAGGLLAAALIRAGAPPLWAIAAASAAGAAIGLLNAALVTRFRLPAPAATLAVAAALWGALHVATCPDSLPINEFAFDSLTDHIQSPLATLRMLLVLGSFAAVVLALMNSRARQGESPASRRYLLAVALTACGALAAFSGAVKLLDSSSAFRPRLVEDLRIPAAALLAGASLFAGPGRTILVCLLLPAACMLSGLWARCVWDWQAGGYLLQVLVLIGMIPGTHAALRGAFRGAGRWGLVAWAGLALCVAGMLLATFSGGAARPWSVGWRVFAGSLVVWAGGVTLTALCGLSRRRESSCVQSTSPS